MARRLSARWPLIFTALVMLLLALGPLWAEAADRGYFVRTLIRVAIFGLAAMSLDFVVGYGGMVSLGHAAFLGIGAYTAGALSFHAMQGSTLLGLPGTDQTLVTWPLALVLGAVFGLAIGGLSLRTKGVYFIMATLAFNQMVFFLFNALEIYGGDDGVGLFSANRRLGPLDMESDTTFFYVCYAVLLLAVIGYNLLVRSPFGKVVRGCHDNEPRMLALGYKTYRYRLVAFAISAAVTSLAGAMTVSESRFLSPAIAAWTESGELLVMIIIGGLGSLTGGIIGAAALFVLEELSIDLTTNWQLYVGLGLLILVLVAPKGLAGALLRGQRNV